MWRAYGGWKGTLLTFRPEPEPVFGEVESRVRERSRSPRSGCRGGESPGNCSSLSWTVIGTLVDQEWERVKSKAAIVCGWYYRITVGADVR